MNQDDELLIKKILGGNQAASKTLYERHESYWFRICLRYARNRTEAQDIFQEGVVKVFQVIGKFNGEKGSFKAWSNKVIVNELLKYLKKNQWQQSFDTLDTLEEKNIGSVDILDKITAKELIQLIQKLPFGYRMVFNLYEIEGYSHREIAEQLNISVGTSKSQLSKAKKALRQQLKTLF